MQSGEPATATSFATRLYGWIGGGLILAAMAVLLFGGAPDEGARASVADEPPPMILLDPATGAATGAPVILTFQTPARLRYGPSGWQAGALHLHAAVDGQEVMPGPDDIEPLSSDRFRWTFSRLARGTRTIRLFWAGPDHRPIPGSGSEPIAVEVGRAR